MIADDYYRQIVETLKGKTNALVIAPERLDWEGMGALLEMFEKTSGRERVEFIRALGKIITNEENKDVLSQAIQFAANLDLAELDAKIEYLKTTKEEISSNGQIKKAVQYYENSKWPSTTNSQP